MNSIAVVIMPIAYVFNVVYEYAQRGSLEMENGPEKRCSKQDVFLTKHHGIVDKYIGKRLLFRLLE